MSAYQVAEKLTPAQKACPQRLKPHSKQCSYRSAEALRHPKSNARSSFSATCYALTPPAKADIFNVWSYIAAESNSEETANRVEQAIYDACALVAEVAGTRTWNPTLAHRTRKDGAPAFWVGPAVGRALPGWTGEGARPYIYFF